MTIRHVCHLQVDYRAGREWRRATVLDVSLKGCRLRVGEELARAASVSVRLTHVGTGGRTLSAQVDGIVIWSRAEGLSHQAGIHFSEEPAELAAVIAGLAQPQPVP